MAKLSNKSTSKASSIQSSLSKLYSNFYKIDDEMLSNSLADARKTAQHLSEITYEETDNIIKTLKQDINKVAYFVQKAGGLLTDWIKLDIKYIEEPILEMLYRIADRTELEIDQQSYDALNKYVYKVGDMVLIGVFTCTKCNSKTEMFHIGELAQCKNCKGKTFIRNI